MNLIFLILQNLKDAKIYHKLLFLGNILCVFVFSQSKLELKPAFANILKCLSVFDTLFLVSFIE